MAISAIQRKRIAEHNARPVKYKKEPPLSKAEQAKKNKEDHRSSGKALPPSRNFPGSKWPGKSNGRRTPPGGGPKATQPGGGPKATQPGGGPKRTQPGRGLTRPKPVKGSSSGTPGKSDGRPTRPTQRLQPGRPPKLPNPTKKSREEQRKKITEPKYKPGQKGTNSHYEAWKKANKNKPRKKIEVSKKRGKGADAAVQAVKDRARAAAKRHGIRPTQPGGGPKITRPGGGPTRPKPGGGKSFAFSKKQKQ